MPFYTEFNVNKQMCVVVEVAKGEGEGFIEFEPMDFDRTSTELDRVAWSD